MWYRSTFFTYIQGSFSKFFIVLLLYRFTSTLWWPSCWYLFDLMIRLVRVSSAQMSFLFLSTNLAIFLSQFQLGGVRAVILVRVNSTLNLVRSHCKLKYFGTSFVIYMVYVCYNISIFFKNELDISIF